jgi:hypothetical protein
MIKTIDGICLYDQVQSFFVVIEYQEGQELNQVKSEVESIFPDKKVGYILVGKEKLREQLEKESDLFISNKSLNFFGKWNKKTNVEKLKSQEEKVVIYLCDEYGKLVKKLMNSFNHALHVGVKTEKMANFDLSFKIDTGNRSEFLNQTAKYLKKL